MVNRERTEDGVSVAQHLLPFRDNHLRKVYEKKAHKIRTTSNKGAYDAHESKYKSYRPKDIYTKLISIGFYRRSFFYYYVVSIFFPEKAAVSTLYYLLFRQYSVLRLLVPFQQRMLFSFKRTIMLSATIVYISQQSKHGSTFATNFLNNQFQQKLLLQKDVTFPSSLKVLLFFRISARAFCMYLEKKCGKICMILNLITQGFFQLNQTNVI